MKILVDAILSRVFGAWLAAAALVLALGTTACPAPAQAPTWTGSNAYSALSGFNNYFNYPSSDSTLTDQYLYPGEYGYADNTGYGHNFTVIDDYYQPTEPYFGSVYTEAEAIEIAEDEYWWSVSINGSKGVYTSLVNNLAQGFIDKQYTLTNFCGNNPPWSGGDPYCWHGTDYTDISYANEQETGGNGGDWFNDDLMWAAMAYARAYLITQNQGAPVSGWLTAAREDVDFVFANAQAETNAANGGTNGTEIGLLQDFCNVNRSKNGTCVKGDTTGWVPNMGSAPNFSFVDAAMMIGDALTANGDTTDATTYYNEASYVYAWAKANLIWTSTTPAQTCTSTMQALNLPSSLSSTSTCAEVLQSNNSGYMWAPGQTSYTNVAYNGEGGFWNWNTPPDQSCGPNPSGNGTCSYSGWDIVMNYGIALQAAVRMGDNTTAQEIANHLMFGISNADWPYAGTYTYGGITYNILPYYGTETKSPNNSPGQNGIALRGVAYGLEKGVLDQLTLQWAQVNVQAAWNNANSNSVMWNNWTPGDVTPNLGGSYTFQSWDDGAAVAGILGIATAAPPPGGN
jgi:hypothetical protein